MEQLISNINSQVSGFILETIPHLVPAIYKFFPDTLFDGINQIVVHQLHFLVCSEQKTSNLIIYLLYAHRHLLEV